MNELKPEDVMRGLEWCSDLRLCVDCPMRAEGYFSHSGNACRQALMKSALALLREKDAEIERLKKHLDYKCIYGYDGDVMEYCVQGPCPYYKRESEVRAEAIDEFADALEKHFCHDPAFLGVEQRLIMDVVKQKAKELKEGTPNA